MGTLSKITKQPIDIFQFNSTLQIIVPGTDQRSQTGGDSQKKRCTSGSLGRLNHELLGYDSQWRSEEASYPDRRRS